MENYTSLEQSKMLTVFGLDPNTADMFWLKESDASDDYENVSIPYSECGDLDVDDGIPCWSTGALIELLPSEIWKDKTMYPLVIVKRNDCYCVEYNANVIPLIGFAKPTLIEALISVYLWVSENGYMEKMEQQNYSVCMKK